jgi:hypothetical protein
MAIRIACPTCKARLTAPDDAAGGSVRCPRCRSLDRVPHESETLVRSVEETDEAEIPLFPSVAGEVIAPGRPVVAAASPEKPSAFRRGLAWGAGFWVAGGIIAGLAVIVWRAVGP